MRQYLLWTLSSLLQSVAFFWKKERDKIIWFCVYRLQITECRNLEWGWTNAMGWQYSGSDLNAKYISILDLTNWGIWQEPLTKEDCPKTTSKELCNFSIFMGSGDIFTYVIRRIGSLANRKFSTTGMEYHVFTGEEAFRGLFNTVSCCWLLKIYISKSCLNGLFITTVGYIARTYH